MGGDSGSGMIRRPGTSIRSVLAIVAVLLALLVPTSPTAKSAPPVEFLAVPSAAMGRDIPVAFVAGGPYAVYLLDAFNAAPDVSNWVTAGGATTTLAGRGFSVAAPAGGAWSMYANWERDGSRQWETFLADELPTWLAANKGLAQGGHAAVGASQGGTAALALAMRHPSRFRYAGSMSGFLTPSATAMNGAITAGLQRFGNVDTRHMWGLPQGGQWKQHDPDVNVSRLIKNNTRLWVFSPRSLIASDPEAMLGYANQVPGSNLKFYEHFRTLGGQNGHFDFPADGDHGWPTWSRQLAVVAADLDTHLK